MSEFVQRSETRFKNGARLRWVASNQRATVVRLNGEWFSVDCEGFRSGEPTGSGDAVYAREFELGDWVEV